MTARASESASDRHFVERVKPLLDSRCLSCHGPDKQKGGLRVDSRDAILKGGEHGPAVVPGKPAESLLVQVVLHAKKDLEMPPKEKLTTNDIAVLTRWIADSVPWPAVKVAEAAPQTTTEERIGDAWSDPRNPIVKIFGGQRLDLWSLKPAQRAELPEVRNTSWVRSPIDQFVLARMESEALAPLPEASRRALGRRVYFDLTGLPPAPGEMDEFLADARPDAYERLVDRLLASSRYGEHAARQWLDVVRYSDSNGFDWDEFRPRAWRFRDYAIRSFNADKPFNQFIREQLAGDELQDGPPGNAAGQDRLIATGYLRLGPHDNSAPLFNEQARSRAELMADLVETTGSAFLGLTMSCCRCHDHKHDPLSQADHFRLRAFFEPVKFADELPVDLASEQKAIRNHNRTIDAQIKPIQEQSDTLLGETKRRLREERIAALILEERQWLELPKENRGKELKGKIEEVEKKIEPAAKEVLEALSKDEKAKHGDWSRQIDQLKKQKRTFMTGLIMTDTTNQVPVTKILFQGNHKDEREPVVPGFISILDPNPAVIGDPINSDTTGRRLTLANWIASAENPLTTRVLVNRVWQAHFGEGLVATANDFGLAGARPSHPKLLDWLATEFVREGWSIKRLRRLILTSATYRQGNLRRLTAEQLRDSLLAVSGLLHDRNGGPPVWPELPAEILQANPAFLDDNAEKTKGWYPSPQSEQNVRSVYMVQKRTVRVPFMETFDLPENAVSCARREESVVAPQAFSLLNSPLAVKAARAFASRVEREAGSDAKAQVKRAFTLALQRTPDHVELQTCLDLLQERSLPELCRALLNLNEFVYLD